MSAHIFRLPGTKQRDDEYGRIKWRGSRDSSNILLSAPGQLLNAKTTETVAGVYNPRRNHRDAGLTEASYS